MHKFEVNFIFKYFICLVIVLNVQKIILLTQQLMPVVKQIQQMQLVQQDNIIMKRQCNVIPVLINAALAKINCLKKIKFINL